MVITFYGTSCFKVQSGETVLAFDPPSKKSEFKSPRFQADIVLTSHDHNDHNGYDSIAGKEKDPLHIKGPGEYEAKKTTIRGILSFHDQMQGKKHGHNTIYVINLDDIKLCHLGDFGEKELRPETKEAMQEIDILLLPIGGDSVLAAESAVKVANQIEPKIIIPMHYDKTTKAKTDSVLKNFTKEMGIETKKAEEKLTLKKKDLPEETTIHILKPQL